MDSATIHPAVEPLTRTTADGHVLKRPVRIETEIAAALGLTSEEIEARARGGDEEMSSECMTHLIRHDLRHGSRQLAENLMPVLLARCESSLRGSVRGFSVSSAAEIREDILGRLAVSMAEPGDQADFLEVRFALSLKRLRIDACRRQRRKERGSIAIESGSPQEDVDSTAELERQAPPVSAGQEDLVLIRQALEALTEEERKVLVLHKLAGVSLRTQASGEADLVQILGRSERTLRNRLRSAEAKLRAFREAI